MINDYESWKLGICLEIWQALGGDALEFEMWMSESRRTIADAWAQLLGAIRDGTDWRGDTNPPPQALGRLVQQREQSQRDLAELLRDLAVDP